MVTTILIEDQIEIPPIRDLDEFRRWATSDEFPPSGRIDFVAGRIEVDMSPEELHSHGKLKVELVRALANRIFEQPMGEVYSDRTRVSCPDADLSAEPDIVFVSDEAIDSGRVRLVPQPGGEPDRYVELEGPPDLIVEIVSDSWQHKDTERLPKAYWRAGVREYWLVDARGRDMAFRISRWGDRRYEPAPADSESYQYSAALGLWCKLDRARNSRGRLHYTLLTKEPPSNL